MDNENKILQVPIEDIIPNRFQPRLSFDESSLKELADSIKQHGIIQPLVLRRVQDKYEIIAGERRYKAAMMAGLASVPAVITSMDDNTSAEVAIVENVQRKDLTAIEEARSYQALLDKGYMTQDMLAKKMGLSQSAISNKLRLLSLDETVQDAVLNEKISERHARSLLKLKDKEEQKKMLNRILTERLTVKQLEEELKKMNIEETINPEMESTNNTTNINSNNVEPVTENSNEGETGQPKSIFGNIFSSKPQQAPNKFFNFLEDEAANMSMGDEEVTPSISPEINPVAPSENMAAAEEEIEMLDFLDSIPNSLEPNESQNLISPYIEEVKNKINSLNLDLTKSSINEEDLSDEYKIIISIKKN